MRVFSWGRGGGGVRVGWSEVLGGRGGLALEGGLWECEGFLRAGKAKGAVGGGGGSMSGECP